MTSPGMSEDEMIATLSSISGESDLEACRARLAAHGFDLEAAVNDALGVSAPPPPPPPPPPSGPRRRRRATTTTTTTRPVPFRSNNDVVGGILSIPFRIVFAVAGAALRVAGGVLSAVLPASITRRVRALPPVTIGGEIDDPVVAAAAFIADFNDKYVRDDDDDAGASSAPAFLPCSHADALREAKRAIKFLFVYLHAPEHEDTDEFCVKTLCDARVVAFLEEHALSWGGDVTTSDAFRLAGVAGVRPSAYPYVALLQNAEGASGPELVMACEGAIDPVGLLEVMMTAIAEQGDVVEAARARRTERDEARDIRAEQDAAFLASLEADAKRERDAAAAREAEDAARRTREAEEAAADAARLEEERKETERLATLARRREAKARTLVAEVAADADGACVVAVKLPNGTRRERAFSSSHAVSDVFDFVDTLEEVDGMEYSLVSNYPRRVFQRAADGGVTLLDGGLHPRAMLMYRSDD